ncbi:lysylphosphatidylglycerol synthetase-like protein (DUF2156 family) [Constrictibacter sp. MBR-5]|jgi:lysylphosphatidylglycerol synthetase-like protein (DUF2156 family)|uniref:hypothetical protein n=1 Tax=Constrictibacter sp. MBR-5 TaxID=3156467 RepID=UPI0033991ECA
MTLVPTLVLFAAAATVFMVARHFHEKPWEPGARWGPPWLAIMFVAALVALVAIAHLVSLVTGTPLRGRFAP